MDYYDHLIDSPDDRRVSVHYLGAMTMRCLGDVRWILACGYGVVPDDLDTVSVAELRGVKLLPGG